MRKTYLEAAHVLVLDSSLQCYDRRLTTVLEVLVGISNTGWMQRLWTLQEGVLANKLWFQFKDEPVELSET